MRIENITVYHVRMPLQHAFVTSTGGRSERDCLILEVRDSEGVVGWGECVAGLEPRYSEETVHTAWAVLEHFLIPILLERSWRHPREFPEAVAWVRGHPMAKAGVEMALWDLYGRRQGRSLKELLGGVRDTVPVGVSVGIQPTPEDLVQRVTLFFQQGYRRIKIKIRPGRDLQDVEAVRRALPEVPLQVDANSAYTLDMARERLRALDDYNLLLIEQPLAHDDLWDHRKLQAELRTPLCLDESIRHRRAARQALEMGACRVINIKQGRVGGLTEAVAIHDVAQERGFPVWCGGMLETGIGRAANLALASLPNFRLPGDISATERYYARDITVQRFTLNKDGTITVPTAPGLGIDVDRDALAHYTLTARRWSRAEL